MAGTVGDTILEAAKGIVAQFERQTQVQMQQIAMEQNLITAQKTFQMKEQEFAARQKLQDTQQQQLDLQLQIQEARGTPAEQAKAATDAAQASLELTRAQAARTKALTAQAQAKSAADVPPTRKESEKEKDARRRLFERRDEVEDALQEERQRDPVRTAVSQLKDTIPPEVAASLSGMDFASLDRVANTVAQSVATGGTNLRDTLTLAFGATNSDLAAVADKFVSAEQFSAALSAIRERAAQIPVRPSTTAELRQKWVTIHGSDVGFAQAFEKDILENRALTGLFGPASDANAQARLNLNLNIATSQPASILASIPGMLRLPDGRPDMEKVAHLSRLIEIRHGTGPDADALSRKIMELALGR